jgi:hypothetical protein
MEKAYKNIPWFFAAILGIVILGFFKTYFGLFPNFDKVTSIQHIHGTLFLLWFVMLIVQPILIQKRKLEWHRRIGRISYFLVPLIIVSIFFIAKEFYETAPGEEPKRIAGLYVPFYQIVSFSVLYLLAIYNKKRVDYHMRYMIATVLAVYGAALRRAFIHWMGMSGPDAFFYTFLFTDLILVAFIVYDRVHGKAYKPYVVSLSILLLSQGGFYFFRNTEVWQVVCGNFVHQFY